MRSVLQLTWPVMVSSSHICKMSNMFCPVIAPAAKNHPPAQLPPVNHYSYDQTSDLE